MGLVTSGLQLSLDSALGILDANNNPISATGTVLATWQDQSGNGNNATANVAGNRPAYKTATFPTGAPAIKFTATGSSSTTNYMQVPEISTLDLTSDSTVHFSFIAGNLANGGGVHTLVAKDGQSGAGAYFVHIDSSFTGITLERPGGGPTVTFPVSTVSGAAYVVTIITSGTSVSCYLNGTQVGTTQTLAAGTATTYPLRICAENYGSGIGNSLDCSVGNVSIYNRAISPTERASNESYLLGRFVTAPSSSMAVSPTSTVAGGSAVPFTLTGTGTSWTSATTPSLTGGTGASIVTQSVNVSTQTIAGTFNPGPAAGTLTWHDSTDSATATTTVTAVAPPSAPTLSGTAGNASATLSWTASTPGTNPLAGYAVFANGTQVGTVGASTLTYGATGLINGTAYAFTVEAYDNASTPNYSAASNSVGLTPQVPTPTAPTGPSATPGNNSVALGWTAPSGASSYNIYRGTTAGGESTTALAAGITATSYTDSTAVNGTTYYYTVKAVNAGGSSPASSEVSATPTAGPALSPATATVYQGATQQLAASGFAGAVTYTSGNAAVATVSGSGLVTGVSAGSATIGATDGTNTRTAAITVPTIVAAVRPSTATLGLSGTQAFTGGVSGSSNQAGTWSALRGTINASGVYTAPASAGSDTVTFTPAANPSVPATASVTIAATVAYPLVWPLGSSGLTTVAVQLYTTAGVTAGSPVVLVESPPGSGIYTGTAQLTPGSGYYASYSSGTGQCSGEGILVQAAGGSSQAFPANFSALSITAGGKVAATVASGDGADASAIKATIGTAGAGLTAVGLAPSQTFNLTGNITGNLSGSVGSVTTVADKAGYSLATPPPTAAAVAAAVWQDLTTGADFATANSVGSLLKNSAALTQAFPAHFAAQAIDASGNVSLAAVPPTSAAIAAAVVAGMATAPVGSVAGAVQVGSYIPGQDPATLLYAGALPASPAAHTSGSVLKQLDGMITGGVFNAGAMANTQAGGTVTLGSAGLDAITIEPGVNARQALSIVFAACGGVVSGAGTGSVVIKGGNAATTRISATTDSNGNRTAVTLALPA